MKYIPLIAIVWAFAAGELAFNTKIAPSAPSVKPTTHRWVDLTHDFAPNMIHWPTSAGFEIHSISDGVNHRGWYTNTNSISLPEHIGTHIDAGIHFAENGSTVEEISLDDLIGPAIVIDVSAKVEADRDYQISTADIIAWESEHGKIADRPIVLFNTGFHLAWPNARAYLGTARRGRRGSSEMRFPGLHPDAARFLIEERGLRAIGIDTPSIDHAKTSDFMAHRIICGANVPIFENLASLDQLPATGLEIIALPMKIRGGSGAPLRIVAKVSSRAS
ncbi:MAG: cyclase family protein [Pseudomonadota bacterium]